MEFHWDSKGIDIYDKEDKWQAGIGGLSAINDPACYIQGEKGKARLKFYADTVESHNLVKTTIYGHV